MSARIDFDLSLLLVRILGAEAVPAIAMYDALRADNVKMNALEAAAKASLTTEQHRVFTAVIRVAVAAQKDRHKIAHWIWARSPELPDALLVADPRHLRARDIEIARHTSLAAMLRRRAMSEPLDLEKLTEPDRDNILVYTQQDLVRVSGDLGDAISALTYFGYYLKPLTRNQLVPADDPLGQALETSDGALRLLSDLRLFQEALGPGSGPTDQSSNPQTQP